MHACMYVRTYLPTGVSMCIGVAELRCGEGSVINEYESGKAFGHAAFEIRTRQTRVFHFGFVSRFTCS